MIPTQSIPNSGAGFARSRGESTAPALWDELRGLWFPALGPTGTTLRDWSGHHRHMSGDGGWTPASWKTGSHGWSVGVTGTNDEGDRLSAGVVPELYPGYGSWTLAAILSFTERPPQDYLGVHLGAVVGAGYLSARVGTGLNIRDDTLQFQARNGTDVAAPVATTNCRDGSAHLIVGVLRRAAGVSDIWIDGHLEASADASLLDGVDMTDTAMFAIGRRYNPGPPGSWGWPLHSTSKVFMAAAWGRALAASEIRHLYRDPFAMVRVDRAVGIGGSRSLPPYRTPSRDWCIAGPRRGGCFRAGAASTTSFRTGVTTGEIHV